MYIQFSPHSFGSPSHQVVAHHEDCSQDFRAQRAKQKRARIAKIALLIGSFLAIIVLGYLAYTWGSSASGFIAAGCSMAIGTGVVVFMLIKNGLSIHPKKRDVVQMERLDSPQNELIITDLTQQPSVVTVNNEESSSAQKQE